MSGLHTEKIDRGEKSTFRKNGGRVDILCALAHGHLGVWGHAPPGNFCV